MILSLFPSWLWHPLGYCVGTHTEIVDCKGYNAWSGSFSDVSEITLVLAVLSIAYGVYRKHRCGHCWRPSRHVVHVQREDGTVETHPSCHWHLDHDHAEKARSKHLRKDLE